MMYRLLMLVPCAAMALNATGTYADPPQWRVGLASVKITPEAPVRMSGYASRTQPSQGVALDLYAKAFAIEDAEGNRAVLVTSDLIGPQSERLVSGVNSDIRQPGSQCYRIFRT